MTSGIRRLYMLLVLACAIAAGAVPAARATIQDDSCMEPDIEYPVPCDDDE